MEETYERARSSVIVADVSWNKWANAIRDKGLKVLGYAAGPFITSSRYASREVSCHSAVVLGCQLDTTAGWAVVMCVNARRVGAAGRGSWRDAHPLVAGAAHLIVPPGRPPCVQNINRVLAAPACTAWPCKAPSMSPPYNPGWGELWWQNETEYTAAKAAMM